MSCPVCKSSMELHSVTELMECCMRQSVEKTLESRGICPNCKNKINGHSNKKLAECVITFLKSEANAEH